MKTFHGIFPVPVTPFGEVGQLIDYPRLETHIEHLIETGIHGIVANGSTSETAMLSDEEYTTVAKTIIDKVDGKLPIIIGATAPSTCKTLEYCKIGEDLGADAFLMLPPYFYPASQSEIIKHFEIIANNTSLPIVIYNNPSTCGIDITPKIVAELAEIDSVKFIKEATGDIARVHQIKALAGDNIDVFAGSDNIFFHALIGGAVGAISASGNVLSDQMVEVFNLIIVKDDITKAKKIFDQIFPVCQFIDGSPNFVQVIKTALEILGKPVGEPRYPLLPLSRKDKANLEMIIKTAELI
jgi:4-hydroxy-tetrahydrodipicolinate synthase